MNFMYKRILLLLALLLPFALYAQTKEISGTILSAQDNIPLPGASVKVKGTAKGTVTNTDGQFKFDVDATATTLVITYVGMQQQEVAITNTSLKVFLRPASRDIDEYVVVAYGAAKKSSYTGAVSQIKKDQIERLQVSSISKALQGLAPGLQSVSASGQPGTEATIRIRGIGSINASSDPLYVVDGAPYSGPINAINPFDIESISILKDAASSALYGSRGANGVIIITTKQGKNTAKGATVNARVSRGISNRAVKDYTQLGGDQYFELTWEALRNAALANGTPAALAAEQASNRLVERLGINPYGPQFPRPVGTDGKLAPGARLLWNDNWQKATQQQGNRTEANLNISGAGENVRYFISGGYLDDQGIALASGFKRYSVRTNLEINAKEWLKIGLNMNAAHSLQNSPPSEDSRTDNSINYGRLMAPIYPIYQRTPDGQFVLDAAGNQILDYGAYRPSAANANTNLIGTAGLDKHDSIRDNVSARLFAEIAILKELKFKTSFNIDYTNRTASDYTNPEFGWDAPIKGTVSRYNSRTLSWTLSNIFTYEKTFNRNHHINLLAGQEAYSYNWRYINGERQNFALPGLQEPTAASQLKGFGGYSIDYSLASYLGRAEYDYQGKYYLSGSLRTDGTSRFSPNRRWGTFWSLGASWLLHREEFLKNQSWINSLSLKASYGGQGNDNIGNYFAYQGLYTLYSNLGEGGTYKSRLGTPNLQWETNLNLNIGVDFSLFQNRLSGTIEYFQRKSQKLLYARPMAPSTGFSSVDENIGALKNTGIDVQLRGIPVQTKDFSWAVDLNVSHYKNRITSLPQQEIISGTKKLMVGKSIYDFFIREWAGVNPDNGNPEWYKVDASGKKTRTSVYADATQVYAGSALPDFFGGLNNTFTYKGISLSVLLTYSVGGKVLDGDVPLLYHNGSSPGRAWHADMINRWTPENRNTDIPKLSTVNNNWTSTSTRFLYDASYARLKNVTLTYALPHSLLQYIHLSGLSIYVQGDNLLTWFGHKGMDPEQTVGGTTYFRYPAIKSFSAGINLSF
ncbi:MULTISPECIES: TonB-dependent receptor [Chitinophaga]|uniref:SusC/RagA family TonB-linked outer membrane protein n=1 Tax=Chitinophaga TaxID=79328 RepID=UPI001CEC7771|nr:MULTISPECIES: TonB-dependent receptor [Chitinophaga]